MLTLFRDFAFPGSAILCFIFSIVFAFRENYATFYGFLFCFVLFTILGVPGLLERLKMPGLEVQLRDARAVITEARLLAKTLAIVALRSAHLKGGWVPSSKRELEDIDVLERKALEILKIIGPNGDEYEEVLEFWMMETAHEYTLRIVRSLVNSGRGLSL